MFHIVLFEPEIPANTGNIIRLCANTGTQLHLIHPLGFDMDDKKLRRAGLDYHEFAAVQEYDSLNAFLTKVKPARIFGVSTKGQKYVHDIAYQEGDAFLFGPETRGLPEKVREDLGSEHVLRIPMQPTNRSLNLSNAVTLLVYEAWRQLDFKGSI
ncbi:MAG: tRNA (uridine(34)/cytosine(34)/5-carboxymethylaminomethyluridine(34)-2'-O)-methyltransferase TrmL [Gammaproteobacteria bacterium]|nr:tRNA (uridine(34)/cytosine(34)/5-carboxymethylaminomethyluridine(34)-2'-O)-methyltransferase TrmL [Gammaproteobacteria bacterium]MCW8986714.1 tRNA (uridine(34)/cytosine(34)/5-carboxymethylaminomethyluridine(34)-2'-O)-methyltransferase TrmL [Gammaproteobacteria bacterium]MCW9030137.1 tRNA (uridine(34)/cytosine(34)/5-carboxymethylaminomethyluridine(34)-2'-O)-methyltransferase TrmL [Gammaproteobacteria bacterium]